MSDIRPLQFACYKGLTGKWGAAQFLLQEPHLVCSSCKEKIFFGTEADDSHYQKKVKCERCGADLVPREGAIFLSVAPTTDKNVYDWKNQKIVFALSVKDVGEMLFKIRTCKEGEDGVKLIHDPNAKKENSGKNIKTLFLNFPQGTKAGGMLKVINKSEEKTLEVTVPLTGYELLTLAILMEAALPIMLSWR